MAGAAGAAGSGDNGENDVLRTVRIWVMGGVDEATGIAINLEDEVEMQPGERFLFVLGQVPDWCSIAGMARFMGAYYVTSGQQGMFRVENGIADNGILQISLENLQLLLAELP